MVTIPVQVSDELASRVIPLWERLPEIIELGLRQLNEESTQTGPARRDQVLKVLAATGIVALPTPRRRRQALRRPILAGGPPASDLILAERHDEP